MSGKANRAGEWCLMSMSIPESIATVRDHPNNTWLATSLCCFGIVVTGLSFENSVLSFFIAAVLCIGLLFYGTSGSSSRITVAKLLLFNCGFLALISLLESVLRNDVGFHFPPVFWPWIRSPCGWTDVLLEELSFWTKGIDTRGFGLYFFLRFLGRMICYRMPMRSAPRH